MIETSEDPVTEAEQAVLGAALLSSDALDYVAARLTASDFYHPKHAAIFEAMSDMRDKAQPVDAVTLLTHLQANGELGKIGGANYLHSLIAMVPTAANANFYAKAVQEASTRRKILALGQRAQQTANSGSAPAAEALLSIQNELDLISITVEMEENPTQRLSDVLVGVIDSFEQEAKKGVPSGFPDLDRYTNGWHEGQMIIVAARPAVGKSTVAIDFAREAAIRNHVPTALFALEMSRTEVIQRIVSAESSVSLSNIRKGELNDDEWGRIGSRVSLMMDAPLYIDDTPGITITEIRTRLRRLMKKHPVGLVIIDYLQLMGTVGRVESRQQAVSEISRNVKLLAKELHIPIIVLSQLNRGPEGRTDKKPLLSDLRESGSLEQDADVVIMLFREDMQDENSPRQGEADLILAKQRQGPIGTIPLVAALHHSKFLPMAHGF